MKWFCQDSANRVDYMILTIIRKYLEMAIAESLLQRHCVLADRGWMLKTRGIEEEFRQNEIVSSETAIT